jgi:hypothetical protein
VLLLELELLLVLLPVLLLEPVLVPALLPLRRRFQPLFARRRKPGLLP